MSNRAARKPRKNEIVAEKIRDYILHNGLKPGDRLPTEDEFATRFNVSRVSVREATRGLAMLGVLDSAPRRGLTVGEVDIEKVSTYIGFHLAMGGYSIESLITTRRIIETGGLEQVAARMAKEPSIYSALNALNHEMRVTEEMGPWVQLDREFHNLLVESTGLTPLRAFNTLVNLFFERFQDWIKPENRGELMDEHQEVIDQLKAGDCNAARKALTYHIESNLGRFYPSDEPASGTT